MIFKLVWFALSIVWLVLATLSGERAYITNALICLVMVELL